MLNAAHRGIQIKPENAVNFKERIIALTKKKGWDQIFSFLYILAEIAECNYKSLASEGFSRSYYKSNNEEKISKIYNFLVQNYQKDLTLTEVAAHANMNAAAFCRYFKSVTNKTLSGFLNDIRIGIACKKLIYTDLTIAEVGYTSGYQNFSYFSRKFKSMKNMSPTDYRMRYQVKKGKVAQ